MKIKSVVSLVLAVLMLFSAVVFTGCEKEEENTDPTVYQSENFAFSESMVAYMSAYTRLMLKEEMLAAGVNTKKSLADQERSDDESWEDYIISRTVENIEEILLYCEAALKDGYTINEGMIYKADETVVYLKDKAEELGMTAEEYIAELYGEKVTLEALEMCTQMMTLCEGYEMKCKEAFEVPYEDAMAYADENPDKFLIFDALRYTAKDKETADKLAAAKDPNEFLDIMKTVSGVDLTDSNKNSAPDIVEYYGLNVANDIAGEFVKEEGRNVGDTTVTDKNGRYTVTMLLSLPDRNVDLLWSYRMLFMSTETSSDPTGDLTSLHSQWIEKKGGEEGFANLASRYSSDPSAYYGGLYDGVTQDAMPTEAVGKWLCDFNRQEGDTVVIPDGNNGAYMLYFLEGFMPAWVKSAENAVRSNMLKEKIESEESSIKEKFVSDKDTIGNIVKATLEHMAK